MAPRLSTMARWINENLGGYEAKVVEGYCNTDRKVGRLRVPGKGKVGNRLKVRRGHEMVLDHNAAETYRRNQEVADWIQRVEGGWVPPGLGYTYRA